MYTMKDMKKICRKARKHGLITKAHVGEFGGADNVMRYAEELELDQIQHGIAAAESPQIMKWLAKHKIQLNLCPTSNIMLSNTKNYETHQIRTLFDYDVPVTINTDDLLIFNATASQEYLNLYNAGLMNAEELNIIRETGLLSKVALG
jgi:adenosine deaminase